GLFYFAHVSAAGTKHVRAEHDAALGLESGEEWAHYGRFVAIDRSKRVQYTWVSQFTRGLESVVTVTFEKQGRDTLLTLNHANLPDDEPGHKHNGGWSQCMDVFGERFRAGRAR